LQSSSQAVKKSKTQSQRGQGHPFSKILLLSLSDFCHKNNILLVKFFPIPVIKITFRIIMSSELLKTSPFDNLRFGNETPKQTVFQTLEKTVKAAGFDIAEIDAQRPWGGFFRIDKSQEQGFKRMFFPRTNLNEDLPMTPKILIIAPNQGFSWQVHERRDEIWKVINGPVGCFLSETDEQPAFMDLRLEGSSIFVPAGTRHRLVSTSGWSVVAEIWSHIDPSRPSDEQDIRRIHDYYNR
jgi:mannose-6-phosphate isomerase